MTSNHGLPLVAPRVTPVLDPAFRPAVLANRAFHALVRATPGAVPVRLAIEQADGSVFRFDTGVLPDVASAGRANAATSSASSSSCSGRAAAGASTSTRPAALAARAGGPLSRHARPAASTTTWSASGCSITRSRSSTRRTLPAERSETTPLGRHLEGCRIGFDLGGSDRKVAAVVDGTVVFSEETVWDPYHQPDPQYHFDGIMDSLQKAAAHLPRVDAIGGSAAGVYVNNRVKVGSLFRGVPRDVFDTRVRDLFLEIRKAWDDVPFEVVNDGEVTALAGSMSLGENAILGIALGTSTAAGYVTPDGNITSWLNELAFVPIDYNPGAAVDEWSGDYGVGSQYFSQQCVGRLLPVAGIDAPADMPLPEEAEAGAVADGERRRPRAEDLRDASARTSGTASRTSPISTTCSTCSCSAA